MVNIMNINVSEMMRLKGRLADISNELDTIFNGVNSELQSISDNVNSSDLHSAILNVQDNVESLSANLSNNLHVLEEFMTSQLESYSVTNEEASESLKNLVNLVENMFDSNGNIIASAATVGAIANSSGKLADPVIGDQSGYDKGANLQNTFSSKIGNSDQKWEIVDKTYYYFKEKGLSDEQIAGILGNMTQESALDLHCPTGQYEGLFQWSKSRQPENFDVETQLEHAWKEIEYDRCQGKVLSSLNETSTVDDATYSFAKWFEGYTGEMEQRRQYANACYYYIKNNL